MKPPNGPHNSQPSGSRSDKELQRLLLARWKKLDSDAHCGGRGLVVGCPTCGKKWGR